MARPPRRQNASGVRSGTATLFGLVVVAGAVLTFLSSEVVHSPETPTAKPLEDTDGKRSRAAHTVGSAADEPVSSGGTGAARVDASTAASSSNGIADADVRDDVATRESGIDASAASSTNTMSVDQERPASSIPRGSRPQEAMVPRWEGIFGGKLADASLGSMANTASQGPRWSPRDDRECIFFLQVSPEERLSALSSCAVESAVLQNPGMDVCLAANGLDEPAIEHLKAELGETFRIIPFDPDHELEGNGDPSWAHPPMFRWFKSGAWRHAFKMVQIGDGLRLYFVWRYGGAYFDLDMWHLRPLDDAARNTVGAQRPDNVSLNGAALVFEQGAFYLNHSMFRFVDHFIAREDKWGWNGPTNIAGAVRELGNHSHMGPSVAGADGKPDPRIVRVLDHRYYYPTLYGDFSEFSDEVTSVDQWLLSKGSRPYTLHLWAHELLRRTQ